MADFLDILAKQAKRRVKEGFYHVPFNVEGFTVSLKEAVENCRHTPIIGEVKFSSPSGGIIRKGLGVREAVLAMQRGGAVGISVLTIPEHFNGSLQALVNVRENVKLPILMKDIIVSPVQLDAAYKLGANAVLIINSLFKKSYCELSVDRMVEYAHLRNLEVLFEVHTLEEFREAAETGVELIGINNRDLKTLKVDLNVTKEILQKVDRKDEVVVSESGIKNADDIRFLREAGADAFLVGSSIMASNNIESKVRELASSHGGRQN